MSREQSYNNKSVTKSMKVLFIKKINIDKSKEINKSIKNYFYNPEEYFSTNSPIRFGKKAEITDISYMKNKKYTKRPTMLNNSSSSKSRGLITKAEKEKERNTIFDHNKFELLDNIRLKYVFDSFKKRINQKKKENYLKYNNSSSLPLNVNVSLRTQQDSLNKIKLNKINNEHLEKYLTKRSKKTRDDLMLNKIDNYLYQKEIIKNIENKKIMSENTSRREWILSLRRPLKIKGVRRSIINVNTDKFPFFSYLIEKSNDLKEISVKPGINLNNKHLKKLVKNAKSTNSINEKQIDRLKNLDDIKIEGKDLWNIEYEREINSQKKKILHKAIIDNGRLILNTEINNVFGRKTFYKDYDKNVYKPITTTYK